MQQQQRRRRRYLLFVRTQLILAVLYIVGNVLLELLPSQLDTAGQGIDLMPREARDLGQARIWT
jgi:hypothetical protein